MMVFRKNSRAVRKSFLLLFMIICALMLSGCTMKWYAGEKDASEVFAPVPMDEASILTTGEISDAANEISDALDETPDEVAQQAAIVPMATPVHILPEVTIGESSITNIDVFYDGTMAMMGFVDVPADTRSMYLLAADLIRQRGIFSNATVNLYRVDQDGNSLINSSLSSQQLSTAIGSPSFYASHQIISLPDRFVTQGTSVLNKGKRLNRFIDSFYAINNLPEPQGEQTQTPVMTALQNINDESLTIVISDLSELFLGNAQLSEIIGGACSKNYSVGLVAIEGEFAGLVPIKGSEITWIQWGSMPSGTVVDSYTYRYENSKEVKFEYRLPIAQSSSRRSTAKRPFYVLMIGKTREMNTHVSNLINAVSTQAPDGNYAYQIFENDYCNSAYLLENNVTAVHKPVDQAGNVVCYERTTTGLPKYQFEMGKLNSNANLIRHVQFDVANVPKPTNPDIGHFSNNTYSVILTMTPLVNGVPGEPMVLDRSIAASIINAKADGTGYSLIVQHPVDVLERGEYRVTVTVYEKRPATNHVEKRFSSFSASIPAQQFYATFDGSRTYGLDGLLDSLNQAQLTKPAAFKLGTFQYDLIINEE